MINLVTLSLEVSGPRYWANLMIKDDGERVFPEYVTFNLATVLLNPPVNLFNFFCFRF
jgi:hypothetical protein